MLIIERSNGDIVTSSNTAADGALPSLRNYWGDVVAVWDTTSRQDHVAACEARGNHPGGSVTVADGQAVIRDADGDAVLTVAVTVLPD